MRLNINSQPLQIVLIILSAILLTWMSVTVQVNSMNKKYLRVREINYHDRVIQGQAGNPYQYRVLGSYYAYNIVQGMRALGFPGPQINGFILARYLQNFILFLLAAFYYRKLGLNVIASLLGVSMLAWGMTLSLYDSYLSYDTYFDIIFYLLAGLIILNQKYYWLIPVMIMAAFNRETGGLIPFMLLAYYFINRLKHPSRKTILGYFGILLAIYVAVFFSLRWYYGEQQFITAYGHYPGINLIVYNVTRTITWENLVGTLGIIPILALLVYDKWPTSLKGFFWVVVPAWFLIHIIAAILAESRLVLVPQALIFIPGALFCTRLNGDTKANLAHRGNES